LRQEASARRLEEGEAPTRTIKRTMNPLENERGRKEEKEKKTVKGAALVEGPCMMS